MGDTNMNESLISSITTTPLYDPVCMLDINREVASGYLILLLGGPDRTISPQKKRRGKRERNMVATRDSEESDEGVVSLAFSSLTDGNVVNACFGAPTQPIAVSSPSYTMARNAKNALAAAADGNDLMKRLAVESYAAGFRIVIDYNDEMARLSPCSRCFKQAELRRKADRDLKQTFSSLSEAVAAST